MGVGHLATIFLILFARPASLANSTDTTTAAATTATSSVSFRSRRSTFTSNLSNSTSQDFQNRAYIITTELEPFFKDKFSSYTSMTVVSFRNGSVINDFVLRFVKTVPHFTEIAKVLVNASSKVTSFDIETSSITVDNIVSSGSNHKISLLTSFCLLLLAWLLSKQAIESLVVS